METLSTQSVETDTVDGEEVDHYASENNEDIALCGANIANLPWRKARNLCGECKFLSDARKQLG